MGRTMTGAHDPSAPVGHLPALRAGRRFDSLICALLVRESLRHLALENGAHSTLSVRT